MVDRQPAGSPASNPPDAQWLRRKQKLPYIRVDGIATSRVSVARDQHHPLCLISGMGGIPGMGESWQPAIPLLSQGLPCRRDVNEVNLLKSMPILVEIDSPVD